MNPLDTTSRELVQKFHAYDISPLFGWSQIKRNTLAVCIRHFRHEKGVNWSQDVPRSCFWDRYEEFIRQVFATSTFPIMHLVCPPRFCISIVFNFSLDGCNTQGKWKTKITQNLGGGEQNKVHYGKCGSGVLAIFSQSPVTVPEVFSKVYYAQSPSRSLRWFADSLVFVLRISYCT